jgi:predicted metal-binding membrane protein
VQRVHESGEITAALAAARVRLGLVAALFVLAGAGWWWTAGQMRGMDEGPWTGLGALGWFLGVWVVMMAAMMLPSVAPTIALYSRMTRTRSPLSPTAFAAGYLSTWAGAGLLAFGVGVVVDRVPGDPLAWDDAGRPVAAATLLIAGLYELTPVKDVCLRRCRSPLGTLLSGWRDGWSGALRMGATNGAWCVGCCWALMASLFALGVMSVVWMALVAGLIAVEKTVPGRRFVTYGTSALLLALGVLLLTAPDAIPALTVPGSGPVDEMTPMSS